MRTLDGLHEIPFAVIAGPASGPLALIMAGVHGDEYEGPAAIHDLIDELDPASVRGSIVFVPVANPGAFFAATRRHPADGGDLNRSFPGKREGTATEQLAHVLFEEFVCEADCILSLHGWSKEALVVPYAEYPDDASEAARISREAANALGFPFLHPYEWPEGVLGEATKHHGIPIVEAEIGGAGTITREGNRLYREVILRFLGHFKIIDCTLGPPGQAAIVSHTEVHARHAGLFRSCVRIGDLVSEGQELGVIRDLDGSVLEALRSPHQANIGVLRTLASVRPGDLLMQLFRNEGKDEPA